LLGPPIARHALIAYVTAEASFAGKRDNDAWAPFQRTVKDAVKQAAVNFCMTPIDRDGLLRLVRQERVCSLPPFIDTTAFALPPQVQSAGPVRLVTTAMMRPGVKLDSYRIVAGALHQLDRLDWTLRIIGDGPERAQVEALFGKLPASRVAFMGELARAQVIEQLHDSDLFVWPGIGEAYGLAYLEAQACGVPVCALASQGVPSVVRDGVSGLLAPDGDVDQFTTNLARLIGDHALRIKLRESAFRFVHDERSLEVAAGILDRGLRRAAGQAT
jgi:glycosyltransferase involved in cell wall biosynthesis